MSVSGWGSIENVDHLFLDCEFDSIWPLLASWLAIAVTSYFIIYCLGNLEGKKFSYLLAQEIIFAFSS